MKIFCSLVLFFLCIGSLAAQQEQALSPRLSPLQKTKIQIGIVDVELVYSRPSMRGRKIFGELVKYDEIWRTGANKNTKLTFHNSIIFGETLVPAGEYSLFTKPNPASWEIYLHKLLDEYGAPEEIAEKDIIAKIKVPIAQLNQPIQSLDISFQNLTHNSANLSIAWEQIKVIIPLTIPTDKIIQAELFDANIDLASKYESAAWTYYEYEKKKEQALLAINKCIQQMEKEEPLNLWLANGNMDNPNRPRRYLLQADILNTTGDKEGALRAAQTALDISKKINSDSYIKRCVERIDKWQAEK